MPKISQSVVHPHINFISRHASRRMSQRGIRSELVRTLLWRGAEGSCGGKAVAVTISDEVASELRAEGMGASDVDRLRRMRAVLSGDGELITVMHRYRRRNRRPAHAQGAR